jgi:hypothetical protein
VAAGVPQFAGQEARPNLRFRNLTILDSERLEALFRTAAGNWPLAGLNVTVRPSRSSDFSGSCFYRTGRVFINIGRNVTYPYLLKTYLAPARSARGRWWREVYCIEVGDAYQLAVFVFMHELYHWLVKLARRNTRQKEARCDRFAARSLVELFGVTVVDSHRVPVCRGAWDFQDLEGFVAAARRARPRIAGRAPALAAVEPAVAARPAIRPTPPHVSPRPIRRKSRSVGRLSEFGVGGDEANKRYKLPVRRAEGGEQMMLFEVGGDVQVSPGGF